MSYMLIILVLLIQHYFFSNHSHVPLKGFKTLFFARQSVLKRLPDVLRFSIWLLFPLILLGVLDWYLLHSFSIVFSVALHFIVLLLVVGYCQVKKAVMQVEKKETLLLPKCLFLIDSRDTLIDSGRIFHQLAILAIRCLFVVLFYSFFFGGYGALMVLLIYSFALNERNNISVIRLVHLLEWLPVRLLYLSLVFDNNFSAFGKAFSSFTNLKTTEELINESIVRDVFEYTSLRNTVKIKRLWLRQLIYWLVCMALLYIFYLLIFL